ncbi:MAG TPA: GNAT family N-acetyltransferase [Vicinamibacterales bacterium]|nr:GNAT family N-acetyltransferase [Vicinamibacterales bacterium]
MVTIRAATITDLPAIVAIYNEAVAQRFATADLDPVTIADRSQWFHDHDPASYPIFVAEREGTVAGWCSLSAHRPGRAALRRTAEISYYVRAADRGRGVATALVQHAIDQAPRLGKHVLFGILLERNDASIRLLKKCGFQLWGRLPDVALIEGELVSHVYYGRSV